MNGNSSDCGCDPTHQQMCVCEIRIGELREAMEDILHKQCDYDPASGESFDFDRLEHEILCLLDTLTLFKTKTILTCFKCLFFPLWISASSDFNVHAGPLDTAFIVDHLSYKSPFADELLVEDLSLKIGQGAHVLVVGNTGTGKTSLLRVLNRLWEADSGECASTRCGWNVFCIFLLRRSEARHPSPQALSRWPRASDPEGPSSCLRNRTWLTGRCVSRSVQRFSN